MLETRSNRSLLVNDFARRTVNMYLFYDVFILYAIIIVLI